MAQEVSPNPFARNDAPEQAGKITFFDQSSENATTGVSQPVATSVPLVTSASSDSTVNNEFNSLVQQSSQNVIDQPVLASTPLQSQTQGLPVTEQMQGTFQLAGFWVRYAALFIDHLILFLVSIAFSFVLKSADSYGLVGSIFSLSLPWIYNCTLLYKWNGETVGKRFLGIRVISEEQQALSLSRIIIRETIGKLFSALPLGMGYFMVPFTRKKQGLHDILAGTIVVYKDGGSKKRTKYVVGMIVGTIILIFLLIFGYFSSIVFDGFGSARKKSQDASLKSYIAATVAPEAALYADNHNDSLIGFVPSSTSGNECSGEPKINISPDGSQMAIFGGLCADPEKYFCSELNIQNGHADSFEVYVYEVDIVNDVTCGNRVDANSSMDAIEGDQDSMATDIMGTLSGLDQSRNRAYDASLMSQLSSMIPEAVVYYDNSGSLAGFTSNNVNTPSECSGPIQSNISADGIKMVMFAKSCTDTSMYICADVNMEEGGDVGLFDNGGLVAMDALNSESVSCGQRQAVDNQFEGEDMSATNDVLAGIRQPGVSFKTKQIASIIYQEQESNPSSMPDIHKPSVQNDIKLILDDGILPLSSYDYAIITGEKEFAIRLTTADRDVLYCMDSYRASQLLEPLEMTYSDEMMSETADCVHNPLK